MSKVSTDLSGVTVVGLDLAKHVFQVHCLDAEGGVVLKRSLRRRELTAFFHRLPRGLHSPKEPGSPPDQARMVALCPGLNLA